MERGTEGKAEIPASIVRKAREREAQQKGNGIKAPTSLEEVWELRRQKMAEKAMEKLMTEDDGDDRKRGDDIDASLDKMMKYQMLQSIIENTGKKKNSDEEPSWVKEMREDNRLIRERLEKKEEEERIEKMRQEYKEEIRELRNELKETRNPDQKDKLTEKITELENKLFKQQEDSKHNELMSRFDYMQSAYDDLKADYQRLQDQPKPKNDVDSFIDQLENIEKKKKTLGKALGLTAEESEKMSVGDMLDQGADLMPKLANGISTIRDAFTTKELDDDLPPPEPNYNMPVRNTPVQNIQNIDPRIEAFLRQSKEVKNPDSPDGMQLVDAEGVQWTTTDGRPLSKNAIRDLALVAPDAVLKRIAEIPPQQRKAVPPKRPEPVNTEAEEPEEVPNDNEEPEQNAQAEQETPEPEGEVAEPDDIEPEPPEDPKAKALGYIGKLTMGKTEDGKDALIGPDGEFYTADDDPITDLDLLRGEAEADPENFVNIMNTAIAQAKQLREQNGSEEEDGQ